MSEKPRNREIVERMAREVKEHFDRTGKPMNAESARAMVADIARKRDRQRADGAHLNKRKGVESGKRRERQEREAREASADADRTVRKIRAGSVFVDLGKKG